MHLAQMPSATTEQVNSFIWGLFGILGILSVTFVGLAAAMSVFRRKPDGERYVEKQELKTVEASLKEEIKKMATVLDGCASKVEVEKLQAQVRDSVHRLSDGMNRMGLEVAKMSVHQENSEKQMASQAVTINSSHGMLSALVAKLVPGHVRIPEILTNDLDTVHGP